MFIALCSWTQPFLDQLSSFDLHFSVEQIFAKIRCITSLNSLYFKHEVSNLGGTSYSRNTNQTIHMKKMNMTHTSHTLLQLSHFAVPLTFTSAPQTRSCTNSTDTLMLPTLPQREVISLMQRLMGKGALAVQHRYVRLCDQQLLIKSS